MNTPEPISNQDAEDDTLHYRPKLSTSQKKRSKLVQVTEEAEPEPAPEPAAPTATPAPAPPPARHHRFKRSGHMHDDLTKPLPEPDPETRKPEY